MDVFAVGRLAAKFGEISKPWDRALICSYRSDIWLESGQHCCRNGWLIWKRSDKPKPTSRIFETSRDLAVTYCITQRIEILWLQTIGSNRCVLYRCQYRYESGSVHITTQSLWLTIAKQCDWRNSVPLFHNSTLNNGWGISNMRSGKITFPNLQRDMFSTYNVTYVSHLWQVKSEPPKQQKMLLWVIQCDVRSQECHQRSRLLSWFNWY